MKALPSDLWTRKEALAYPPPGPEIAYEEGAATLAFSSQGDTVVLAVHPYHLYHGELRTFFKALDHAQRSLPPVKTGEMGLILVPESGGASAAPAPVEFVEVFREAARTPWCWRPLPERSPTSDAVYRIDGRSYRARFLTAAPHRPQFPIKQ